MRKALFWIFVIAAGVFLGLHAHEQFSAYRERASVSAEVEAAKAEHGAVETQRRHVTGVGAGKPSGQAGRPGKREMLCSMVKDMNDCRCIDVETGAPIPMPPYSCVLRLSRQPAPPKD